MLKQYCSQKALGRGERVAISATPGPSYVVAMHAAWMCGAIAVPIATSHTPEEVEYVLSDARVRVMAMITDDPDGGGETVMIHSTTPQLQVTSGKGGKSGKGGGKGASGSRDQDRGSGGKRGGKSSSGSHEPEPDNAPEDGALIIYTSGTTGQPKARPGKYCPHTSSTCILNPRLLIQMASYDAASSMCQALVQGGAAHARQPGRAVRRAHRRVGVGCGRPDIPRATAAPHSRHRQRVDVRARRGWGRTLS